MIVLWLVLSLVAGGLLAWALGRLRPALARWVSLVVLLADLMVALGLWVAARAGGALGAGVVPGEGMTGGPGWTALDPGAWIDWFQAPWIPGLGISIHLAVDGLSLVLVVLTLVLGILAVLASWTEIQDRVGLFHLHLLWVLGGVVGVFSALDLFLFYFFWELMLIPMYFLIAVWGHEDRLRAAVKFFLFTQGGGFLMLLAILGLALVHQQSTGILTFDYVELLGTSMGPSTAMVLMLGFFVGFAVKLPVFGLHSWLPDAHTEAPTAGSVVLAGLLLKTGAYGLIRFALPLFPEASRAFAPVAAVLGTAGILYGALLALSQMDLKRLVAYTSVSHLGFVLLGIYAMNAMATEGAVFQMVTHGLSTGGLFIVVGILQERLHSRDLAKMGGFWEEMPRLGGLAMVLAMASLGLPGLGSFVAEFLVLAGSWPVFPVVTAVAVTGLVAAAIYALRIVQSVFHGKRHEANGRGREGARLPDLGGRELASLSAVAALLLWLGLFPQPVLESVRVAMQLLGGGGGP
ncbi:MAG: NADH-quinone oxidoreductase subunit M [Gemmatimonadota bacterium]